MSLAIISFQKEEAALRDYEEEQMRLEKRQKQQAAKRSRDKSIKMKNKQLVRHSFYCVHISKEDA